jgi:hypothetical protein
LTAATWGSATTSGLVYAVSRTTFRHIETSIGSPVLKGWNDARAIVPTGWLPSACWPMSKPAGSW